MKEHKLLVSSKFLSLVLRHKPELIGLELDAGGWAGVDELIEKFRAHGKDLDSEELKKLVETNDKKRFSFNNDRSKIRANQGHSIQVDLDLQPQVPPQFLYHGTTERFVTNIFLSGLQKMKRQHVHLSNNPSTAIEVGRRHGKPVVFEISAGSMYRDDYIFYLSENGVWLTDEVPVAYMKRI